MSNDIRPFLFEGQSLVRVEVRDGQPWFVVADVCRILGIKNPADAVKNLDEDEKGIALSDTLGRAQSVVVVSEGGLYTLALRSRDAVNPGSTAHRFRKWVTGEVLPSIRRTGSYGQPIGAAEACIVEPVPVRRQLVSEARAVFGLRAAGQLWFKLNLPVVPAMFEPPAQADFGFTYTALPYQPAEPKPAN